MSTTNFKTIEQLILGATESTKITINYKDNDYDFNLRPLTDGELTKIRKIEYDSLNFKVKIDEDGNAGSSEQTQEADVNTGEFTEKQTIAKYTAIAWSLSNDEITFTTEDIERLPKGIPNLLFEKVIEVSGLRSGDLTTVKNFLNNE